MVFLAPTNPADAQVAASQPPLPLQRLQRPIELDGRLDEPAWAALDTFPMVAYKPVAGEPPTERTVFKVGYDDEYLYVGARLYETDPEQIAINTYTRDRWANDDLIEIVIDSYNDNETGVILSVTPAGTRLDAQVSQDAEFTYGFPINYSWDAFWDAATRRTEEGWFAEVRVPFSSLRFQDRDGRVVMGLILTRFISRKNETVTFPTIDPRWNFGFNKPSQARDVVLERIEPTRPLYVSPYVLSAASRTYGTSSQGVTTTVERSEVVEMGGDVRYALTDNLNLDVTLNPDFAQAEADDQQVSLDRFSLFFPEKRRFFQERSGIFEFRTGQNNRLFHSRRIGIVDEQLIPIYAGGRIVGRMGGWDVGALDMQTAEAAGVPSENFGVLRLRRNVINPFSYLGGMVTTRVGGDRANVAYGLDGTFRLGGSRYVLVNWAQSFVNGRGGLASATGRATLEDRSRDGLGYQLSIGRAGDGYDPGIGFVQRVDYRQVSAEVRYGFLASGEDARIQRVGPRIESLYLTRDSDGELETAQLTVGGQLETARGFSVSAGVSTIREVLVEGFALGGGAAAVPAGRYDFVSARTFISSPGSRALQASLFARAGQYFDGSIVSLSLSPRWRMSPHFTWGVHVQHSDIRFPERDQHFTADILRWRGTLSYDTHLSADVFVQYNSRGGLISSNLRIRYNFAEGRDLWFVYNEARNTLDRRDGELLPGTQGRTVLLKYVHTLGL